MEKKVEGSKTERGSHGSHAWGPERLQPVLAHFSQGRVAATFAFAGTVWGSRMFGTLCFKPHQLLEDSFLSIVVSLMLLLAAGAPLHPVRLCLCSPRFLPPFPEYPIKSLCEESQLLVSLKIMTGKMHFKTLPGAVFL